MKIHGFALLALVGSALLLSQCGQPEKGVVGSAEHREAIQFMQANCNSCHHPTSGPNARVAPPMAAVRDAYLAAFSNYPDFEMAFVNFVHQPTRDRALMQEAVQQFGLMPAMALDGERLKALATYLFAEQPEAPAWYLGHDTAAAIDSLELAMGYAMTLKQTLGKNLLAALEEGGPVYALDFCNTRAIPLTDSVSQSLGIEVVRLSDKPRNPNNKADAEALAVISKMQAELAMGNEPKGIMQVNRAYFPITTNDMCLKCHGVPGTSIKAQTMAAILERYPGDQAIGYSVPALRGVFRVTFEE
jgi:cytochrome c553